MMVRRRRGEGLKAARLLMVLSSISPLFILWGVRGNNLMPDRCFFVFCALMVVVPNGFLWLRLQTARRLQEKREIAIGRAEDHREHLLVYLFAMLLPFYTADLANWRAFGATLAALGFIVLLFWHLNLHYMNVLFALLGYRVFTVFAPEDDNALTGRTGLVLITRRVSIRPGKRLSVYRLSDTVYVEVDSKHGA